MLRVRNTGTLQDKLDCLIARLAKIAQGKKGGRPDTFESDCFTLLKCAYKAQRQVIADAVLDIMYDFSMLEIDSYTVGLPRLQKLPK